MKTAVLKFGGNQANQWTRKAGIGFVIMHLAIASLWAILGAFDWGQTRRYTIGFW